MHLENLSLQEFDMEDVRKDYEFSTVLLSMRHINIFNTHVILYCCINDYKNSEITSIDPLIHSCPDECGANRICMHIQFPSFNVAKNNVRTFFVIAPISIANNWNLVHNNNFDFGQLYTTSSIDEQYVHELKFAEGEAFIDQWADEPTVRTVLQSITHKQRTLPLPSLHASYSALTLDEFPHQSTEIKLPSDVLFFRGINVKDPKFFNEYMMSDSKAVWMATYDVAIGYYGRKQVQTCKLADDCKPFLDFREMRKRMVGMCQSQSQLETVLKTIDAVFGTVNDPNENSINPVFQSNILRTVMLSMGVRWDAYAEKIENCSDECMRCSISINDYYMVALLRALFSEYAGFVSPTLTCNHSCDEVIPTKAYHKFRLRQYQPLTTKLHAEVCVFSDQDVVVLGYISSPLTIPTTNINSLFMSGGKTRGNMMNDAIRRFYPIAVPRVKTVQDAMRLRLSHLHVRHQDRQVVLDTNGVTHVKWGAVGKWTTLPQYARAYAACVSLVELADLRLHRSALPELEVHRVRTAFRGEAVPTYVAFPPSTVTEPKGVKNAFVFRSFDYDSSSSIGKSVADELERLWLTRNSHPSIHFHLEGNGGGGLTAVYLLVRCLAGARRPWMVEECVLETETSVSVRKRRWDPWAPEHDPNQRRILQRLRFTPKKFKDYATPYAGPITLHVDPTCMSSTWYFITLMIYAFGGAIERRTERWWGVPVKVGRATGGTLRIEGSSSTSSGDGNAVEVRVDGLGSMSVPTQASVRSPIERRDFGRFWLPHT